MYFAHYNPQTAKVLGFLDGSLGIIAEDDGTEYFSISNDEFNNFYDKVCYTNGKIITTEPPPNSFAILTDDGWQVDENQAEQVLAETKTQAITDIHNSVVEIYNKFAPLSKEYEIREKQARAFQEAKYKGDVPPQVKAVAEPSELTAKEATDLIISEADKMEQALETLGALRMQKIAINRLQTIEAVNQHKDSVLAQISEVAKQL
ncbi:MAG: hypothetical protein KGV50_07455 [Gammaproteobacteria bacterium]|nr:hypothetical protein [Gammaproteobacteria bacterium]